MRIAWIDLLRGFCMMAILWFHSEMYYAGSDIIPYECYVGDVLAVFFFLSGYLLFTDKTFHLKRKIRSLVRYLVVPYFLFTSLIAWPKAIAHGNDSSLEQLFLNVVSGQASWFVPALIVAQAAFILLLATKKKSKTLLPIAAIACLLCSAIIGNNYQPTSLHYKQNLWHVNEAMLGFFIMYLGYLYRRHEGAFQRLYAHNTAYALYMLLLAVITIILKIVAIDNAEKLIFGPIIVSNYTLFTADLIAATLLLVGLFQRLPRCIVIEWTGAHSLVYYFLCGGVPFVVSSVLRSLSLPYTGILSMMLCFVIVYAAATLLTWLIYRYTPIMRKVTP